VEFEQALTGTRWKIIATLAEGQKALSQIATATETSLPNISQQAKLLEAYGIIKAQPEKKSVPGKPKLNYSLAKQQVFIALAKSGMACKKSIVLDPITELMLNILFWEKKEDRYCLQKFYWQQEAYVNECSAIAVTSSNDEEIHLLVIAEQEKLEQLRKEFSKIEITCPQGKKKKIISWTHSMEELLEGLEKKEEYYEKLIEHPHIIKDPSGILTFRGVE
jgi:DNA-binding transcriptional ArsR family regulator